MYGDFKVNTRVSTVALLLMVAFELPLNSPSNRTIL